MIPQELKISSGLDLPEIMGRLGEERKARVENTASIPIFIFILGLQKFKKLRHEDDFDFSFGDDEGEKAGNPGAEFDDLVMEGGSLGLHLFVCVDTYNNVNRFFSRKALSEFEMRIVFQMSANDCAALADTPRQHPGAAPRPALQRAAGHLETFRPYALPDRGWLEEVAKQLKT